MRCLTFLLVLAASVFTTGCLQKWPSESKTRYVPVEQCAAAGGTIEMMGGLAPSPGCLIRNPDAGKVCTDSSQCAGRCIVDDDGDEELQRGAQAKGICEPDNGTIGCFAEVRRGRLTGSLCVD